MSITHAKRLIQQAKEQRLTRLDLGRCGLTDLETEIPELFELDWLEELYLSNHWYDYEKQRHIHSQNEGEDNFLSELPKGIDSLKALKVLVCGGDIA